MSEINEPWKRILPAYQGNDRILCDTCGGPCQGGTRRYTAANGDSRIGCDDDHACAAAFSALTRPERRLVEACRKAGNYLKRAEEAPDVA